LVIKACTTKKFTKIYFLLTYTIKSYEVYQSIKIHARTYRIQSIEGVEKTLNATSSATHLQPADKLFLGLENNLTDQLKHTKIRICWKNEAARTDFRKAMNVQFK